MTTEQPSTTPLPKAYQGLSGTQALAQVFFRRTEEAVEVKMPLYILKNYLADFNEAKTFQGKQRVVRAITADLLQRRQ